MANILLGFQSVLAPMNLLVLLGGVMIGMVVGALPGLNDSITLAVLIPVTFGMNPQTAMCLLIGIYVSACYGGSIPSILLKIPGTASSVVTAFDGQPMTQKGKAGLALSISTTSSVFGGIMSSLVLLFFSPFLAAQALKFGPPEYLMLAIMGMSTVVGMAGKYSGYVFRTSDLMHRINSTGRFFKTDIWKSLSVRGDSVSAYADWSVWCSFYS